MTTIKKELQTLKEMLVEIHNDTRNSKRKNISNFAVSMVMFQVIIQANKCLNKLDEVEKKEQSNNMANDTVHQQLFGI